MAERTLKKAAEQLFAAGVQLPEPMMKFVRDQDRIRRGVVQVWGHDRRFKCKEEYESSIRVKAVECKCGGMMHLIWPK